MKPELEGFTEVEEAPFLDVRRLVHTALVLHSRGRGYDTRNSVLLASSCLGTESLTPQQ